MCIRDRFYGEMYSNLQFEYSNPSSNLGKNWYFENSATTFFENLERNKIARERVTSNAMFLIASYFTAYFLENS